MKSLLSISALFSLLFLLVCSLIFLYSVIIRDYNLAASYAGMCLLWFFLSVVLWSANARLNS